jgi:hypothetical protein
MNVEIDPAIQADPWLADAVHSADLILQAELDKSSGTVSASWSVVGYERERPVVRLTISDSAGSADAVLAADQLGDSREVRSRLLRLWGDLLRIRSDRNSDEFLAPSVESSREPTALRSDEDEELVRLAAMTFLELDAREAADGHP